MKKRAVRVLLIVAVLDLVVVLSLVHIVSAFPPAWKGSDDEQTLETQHLFTKYTTNATDYPDAAITGVRAGLLASDLEDAWTAFVSWGFNPPTEGGKVYAWVVSPSDLSCGSTGCAKKFKNRIEVVPSAVRQTTTDQPKETPHHELFHREQNTYAHDKDNPGATWIREGTATLIQDSVFPDIDGDASSSFARRANSYLANLYSLTSDPADKFEYKTNLFWKYYVEQIGGTPASGPGEHLDALVWFFERGDEDPKDDKLDDFITIFNERVFPAHRPDMTFEKLFQDFIVANYVKQFSQVCNEKALPSRFCYKDELDRRGTPYDPVTETSVASLSPGNGLTERNQDVLPWAPLYYVGFPDASCKAVQVSVQAAAGRELAASVLATRGDDAFFYDHPGFRTIGEDFSKTLYNDAYDGIVAIVAGQEFGARFDLSMRCVSPRLDILWPTETSPAAVGDPGHPRPFILRLAVKSGEDFVEGLDAAAFDIKVDGKPASIIEPLYVQSQYWLVTAPPTVAAPGDYDLSVGLNGYDTDVEAGAVRYSDDFHLDEVLVIDRSGSMAEPDNYPKILAAKNAARLYTDELVDGDQLGVVSFATTATVDLPLELVDDDTRVQAKDAIDNLEAWGWTTIGGGLETAVDELTDHGVARFNDVIVLLSDGMQTRGPYWDDVKEKVLASGIPVYTVALGPETDQDLMQEIADATKGLPLYSDVPAGSTRSTAVQIALDYEIDAGMAGFLGVDSRTLPSPEAVHPPQSGSEAVYHLSGIYDFIETKVSGDQRILMEEGAVQQEHGWYRTQIYLDDSLSQATFSFAYEDGGGSASEPGACGVVRQVILTDPNQVERTVPARTDTYHDIFEVESPQAGWWEIAVQMYFEECGPVVLQADVEASSLAPPYHFLTMVSGQTDLALASFVGTPIDARQTGAKIPLLAYLLDGDGLVKGVTIEADVTGCGFVYPLTFLDDGRHDDGDADDGVYGTYFTQTSCEGSYVVEMEGRHGDALRQAVGSFYTREAADNDGDGLPDDWERAYGLDPNLDNLWMDPDLDYLPNLVEYAFGTNPIDDDTDGGGESDISELFWGQDAINNPQDDQIDVPTGFYADAGNGQNVLSFNVNPDYHRLGVMVTDTPNPTYRTEDLFKIRNTGSYSHTELINDRAYYYRLAGGTHRVRLIGRPRRHVSGYANPAAATPKIDPYPPEGYVLINDDAESTDTLQVTLTLWATGDTTEMMIANEPTFKDAVWEPYASTKAWTLEGEPGEAAFVYVKLKDGANNVSGAFGDGIMIE